MSAYVKHNIENHIATIEFFHPEQNSLPGAILAQLANTITEVGNMSEVKVIILKSGGERTFCAGASFQELIAIDDAATGKVFFSGFANVINAMRKCPKFILGRIQGKTVGGGVGIAASTDYCMATQFASIKLSELNVGIGHLWFRPPLNAKWACRLCRKLPLTPIPFMTPTGPEKKACMRKCLKALKQWTKPYKHLPNICAPTIPKPCSK